MKILIINPNTSVEMSRTIDSTAQKCASPGTEITTVNPPDGPEFIAKKVRKLLSRMSVSTLLSSLT